ncbi:MAG: hypothetical protein ACTSPY_06745 [Candidatus Helarchaeota archaeon]
MPKLIKISTEKFAVAGIPHQISITFDMTLLESDTSIDFAGVKLISNRPCKKDIIISKTDIFYDGILETGIYTRNINVNISRSVVPTVKDRDIGYFIRGNMVIEREKGKREEYFDDHELIIIPEKEPVKDSKPLLLQIKNIKIKLDKDVYQKGDKIKINYEIDKIKSLKISLIKDSNIYCHCPDYTKCAHIKEIPPKILSTIEFKNPPPSDIINFELPNELEPSHNWKWIGASTSYFENSIGDNVSYNLGISGTTYDNEIININAPIMIVEPAKEEFFLKEQPNKKPFETIFSPKNIELLRCEVIGDLVKFKLKNKSEQKLEGVTIIITGIQQSFFETLPWMIGKREWNPGETIEVSYKGHNADIESYQFIIETNSGIKVKKIQNF